MCDVPNIAEFCSESFECTPGMAQKYFIYYYYYYYYYYYNKHHLLYAGYLYLLFMLLISLVCMLNLLYFYISTFRSMCAVLNMAVFCSSLT